MSDGELWFQPGGAVLRDVRAKVRELAAGLGAASSVCDNFALVVDELVNNAIEHGACADVVVIGEVGAFDVHVLYNV